MLYVYIYKFYIYYMYNVKGEWKHEFILTEKYSLQINTFFSSRWSKKKKKIFNANPP